MYTGICKNSKIKIEIFLTKLSIKMEAWWLFIVRAKREIIHLIMKSLL